MLDKIPRQNPIRIANLIVSIAISSNKRVTNLQLQKIMFLLQGYLLAKYKVAVIDGDFLKWKYCPIQKEAHNAFKDYGSTDIDDTYKNMYFKNDKLITDPLEIKDFDQYILYQIQNAVFDLLMVSTSELNDRINAFLKLNSIPVSDNLSSADKYTNDEIQACYEANKSLFSNYD